MISKVVVIVTTFVLSLRLTDTVPNGIPAGFQFLGSTNDEFNTDGNGSRDIHYYLSEDEVNHNDALVSCKDRFGGRLLTPLNPFSINVIRIFLEAKDIHNIHIWTAGRQAEGDYDWYWSTSAQPIPIHIYTFEDRDHTARGRCLSVFGDIGNFGLCADLLSNCNHTNRYICEFGDGPPPDPETTTSPPPDMTLPTLDPQNTTNLFTSELEATDSSTTRLSAVESKVTLISGAAAAISIFCSWVSRPILNI